MIITDIPLVIIIKFLCVCAVTSIDAIFMCDKYGGWSQDQVQIMLPSRRDLGQHMGLRLLVSEGGAIGSPPIAQWDQRRQAQTTKRQSCGCAWEVRGRRRFPPLSITHTFELHPPLVCANWAACLLVLCLLVCANHPHLFDQPTTAHTFRSLSSSSLTHPRIGHLSNTRCNSTAILTTISSGYLVEAEAVDNILSL